MSRARDCSRETPRVPQTQRDAFIVYARTGFSTASTAAAAYGRRPAISIPPHSATATHPLAGRRHRHIGTRRHRLRGTVCGASNASSARGGWTMTCGWRCREREKTPWIYVLSDRGPERWYCSVRWRC
jgi:hypothetical protein